MTGSPPDRPTRPFPERLVRGYRTFLGDRFAVEQDRYQRLAEVGQQPRIMVIGCCDSRVAPEVIFNAGPGEIFVVRNVANLVPPYGPDDAYHGTSAALEFAVMGLRVEHIVVLGHARCGGVRAFAEGEVDPYTRPLSAGDFIGKWVRLIAPAYARAGAAPVGGMSDAGAFDAYVERIALESVRSSLANLRTFPWLKTLEDRGLVSLHGAYFGVMDGRLMVLDERIDAFGEAHGASV